jgi:hypothetical protein
MARKGERVARIMRRGVHRRERREGDAVQEKGAEQYRGDGRPD